MQTGLTVVVSRLWTCVRLTAGGMITESYRKRRASDTDEVRRPSLLDWLPCTMFRVSLCSVRGSDPGFRLLVG